MAEGQGVDADLVFEWWLTQYVSSEESAKIYRFMWHKWRRWARDRAIPCQRWSHQHLERFLDEADLHKAHRQRYERLIERVLQSSDGFVPDLPGTLQGVAREQFRAEGNAPTLFLSRADREIIEQYLGEIPPLPSRLTFNAHQWRECRDPALVAVFYGAGVKVSQVRRVERNAIAKSRNVIRLTRGPDDHEDSVEILAVTRRTLAQWLRLLGGLKVPGEYLFPAARDGKPMHAASVFRRVRLQLEQIGIAEEVVHRLSPQTLRNTYAAIRLDRGDHIETVGAALGLQDTVSPLRLKRAYLAWRKTQ
jgi:integrase